MAQRVQHKSANRLGIILFRIRCELSPVIDSWMEWDIKVPHGWHKERIKVLSFSPASARKKNQPYPPALLKLGCLIWKLRNDVFGDEAYGEEPFYHQDDCKSVLEIQ